MPNKSTRRCFIGYRDGTDKIGHALAELLHDNHFEVIKGNPVGEIMTTATRHLSFALWHLNASRFWILEKGCKVIRANTHSFVGGLECLELKHKFAQLLDSQEYPFAIPSLCFEKRCPTATDWFDGQQLILKATQTAGRRQMTMVRTREEVVAWTEMYPTVPAWVLQKYISTPLLWKDRKFHLRCYWLVTGSKGILPCNRFEASLLSEGVLYFAQKRYTNTVSTANQIRDVHLTGGTEQAKVWPQDFVEQFGQEKFNHVFEQIENASRVLALKALPQLHVPAPGKAGYKCYRVLALDVLIDTKFQIHLMEVNIAPGTEFARESTCTKIAREIGKFALGIERSRDNGFIKLCSTLG